jgi:hypothetical protein
MWVILIMGTFVAVSVVISVWLSERYFKSGHSESISAVVFGVIVALIGIGIDAQLLFLPYGARYDSLDLLGEISIFYPLAGIALCIRALIWAKGWWKLFAPIGLAIMLAAIPASYAVYSLIVDTKDLVDLW